MKKSSVVLYKNFPALVGDSDGDKFQVNWCVSRATATGKKAVYASQKVRDKDVILLSFKMHFKVVYGCFIWSLGRYS